MKKTMQMFQSKNWKATTAFLMLSLTLGALTSFGQLVQAAPKQWIPSLAVSDYTDFAGFTASPLTHQAPGSVANYTTIIWGAGEASIQLDNYEMRLRVVIGLNVTHAGQQITAIQIRGLGGPELGPWWHHSSDWIPCTPVAFNLATGFVIHVHQDNIPIWRHATQKSSSPRVEIAGQAALGDVVVFQAP